MIPLICTLTTLQGLKVTAPITIPDQKATLAEFNSMPKVFFVGKDVVNLTAKHHGNRITSSGRNGAVYATSGIVYGGVLGRLYSESSVIEVTFTPMESFDHAFPGAIVSFSPRARTVGASNKTDRTNANRASTIFTSRTYGSDPANNGLVLMSADRDYDLFNSPNIKQLAYRTTASDTGKAVCSIPTPFGRSEISMESLGRIFTPSALSPSGIVVGTSAVLTAESADTGEYHVLYSLTSIPIIKKYETEPTYWQDGEFHVLPLPAQLVKKGAEGHESMNLLMEWNGCFLAESTPLTDESYRRHYWVYKNKAWIDLADYMNDLPNATIADYDITTGRILLANESSYKVIQL